VAAAERAGVASAWNWDQERLKIEKMVASWEDKHRDEILEARAARQAGTDKGKRIVFHSDGDDNVVPFGPALAAKQLKRGAPKVDKNFHRVIVRRFLENLESRNERVIYNTGMLWHYRGGLWSSFDDKEERDWLNRELSAAAQDLKATVKANTINEARFAVHNSPQLYVEHIEWDAHSNKVPTQSGLVDLDTGKVEPLKPEHYATYRIECVYDPKAKCPLWKQTLKDCLDDDAVSVFQEVMGAALIVNKPKEWMKALVLVGPSNSGKSTLLNTAVFFLSDEPITTPLDDLDDKHGTALFAHHRPWYLPEAFEASKWHPSAKFKALLSGDPINIDRKYHPPFMHRYRGAVFIGANTPPQFKDASKAVRNRLIIQPCSRVFDEENPTGMALEARKRGFPGPAELILATERSGLLNWAIEGWRRLKKRGYYVLTKEQKQAANKMEEAANCVQACVEELFEYDPKGWVTWNDFYAVHAYWWLQNREERFMPPNSTVQTALQALDPRIRFGEKRTMTHRYISGIYLNQLGRMELNHAIGALSKTKHQYKITKTSSEDELYEPTTK
jgi:P4 family phage/plasmid primase-like protien